MVAEIDHRAVRRRAAGDVGAGLDFADLLAVLQPHDVQDFVAPAEDRLARARDGRRAVDEILRLQLPHDLPAHRVEAIHRKIVAAHEHPLRIGVGRLGPVRAAHDFVARLVLPLQRARRRVERVEESVRPADVAQAVEQQRRGLDAALGLESPRLLAIRERDAMHRAIVIAKINAPPRNGRAALHRSARLESPPQRRLRRSRLIRAPLQQRPAAMHRPVAGEALRNREAARKVVRSVFILGNVTPTLNTVPACSCLSGKIALPDSHLRRSLSGETVGNRTDNQSVRPPCVPTPATPLLNHPLTFLVTS